VELRPEAWMGHRYLGKIALHREAFDRAEAHFKELQRLCPLDPTSYSGLAAIYLHRGADDEALGQLLQLAEGRQYDDEVPAQLARIYRRKQAWGEAEHWFRSAIFVNPLSAPLHWEYAELLSLAGKSDLALVEYEMLTRLEPAKASHWENAALTAQKLGRIDVAQGYARTAVKLDPASSAAAILPEDKPH